MDSLNPRRKRISWQQLLGVACVIDRLSWVSCPFHRLDEFRAKPKKVIFSGGGEANRQYAACNVAKLLGLGKQRSQSIRPEHIVVNAFRNPFHQRPDLLLRWCFPDRRNLAV